MKGTRSSKLIFVEFITFHKAPPHPKIEIFFKSDIFRWCDEAARHLNVDSSKDDCIIGPRAGAVDSIIEFLETVVSFNIIMYYLVTMKVKIIWQRICVKRRRNKMSMIGDVKYMAEHKVFCWKITIQQKIKWYKTYRMSRADGKFEAWVNQLYSNQPIQLADRSCPIRIRRSSNLSGPAFLNRDLRIKGIHATPSPNPKGSTGKARIPTLVGGSWSWRSERGERGGGHEPWRSRNLRNFPTRIRQSNSWSNSAFLNRGLHTHKGSTGPLKHSLYIKGVHGEKSSSAFFFKIEPGAGAHTESHEWFVGGPWTLKGWGKLVSSNGWVWAPADGHQSSPFHSSPESRYSSSSENSPTSSSSTSRSSSSSPSSSDQCDTKSQWSCSAFKLANSLLQVEHLQDAMKMKSDPIRCCNMSPLFKWSSINRFLLLWCYELWGSRSSTIFFSKLRRK